MPNDETPGLLGIDDADDELDGDTDESLFLTAKNAARADSYIAEHTEFSRSAVQRLISDGFITVNGRTIKPRTPLSEGDTIEIRFPETHETELTAEPIPLDIVYQDADIAVINKPVGMVVHPAAGNPNGTLVNALMYHIKDLSGIGGKLRPGIVHRIDKNTSWLLVVAKNDFAHSFLSEELKTHSVQRTYIALCLGNFPVDSGTISAPIGRHRADRKRMAVVSDGREAITHYRVLERYGDMTLLEVRLETGRTHQIRVHMAYINHPLVGDDVYSSGRNSLGFHGQALHACELKLRHPRTHEWMSFHADLPEHYQAALNRLRREKH